MDAYQSSEEIRREVLESDRQQIAYFLELDWPATIKARLMSRYVELSTQLEGGTTEVRWAA
jgi:hypothetical protein